MSRQLAQSTLDKFRAVLEEEQTRLRDLLEEHEQEREKARLAETAAERSPDPTSAEGGSMVFEYEKDLSVDANTEDLLRKATNALERLKRGEYGICESCGIAIPVARLEVLPYTTLCVDCAQRR
ncbi:MAG: TraR/DksA family transcriptional regulator [Acidimicrobiia bacterium]|nr:TraR/DksA family transcriptional regulator [Acidimicrobiia bacterium]MDH5615597.1 TraR/DksA family transcriptional regulator [Acidimicrobiia bacterium]